MKTVGCHRVCGDRLGGLVRELLQIPYDFARVIYLVCEERRLASGTPSLHDAGEVGHMFLLS